MNIRITALLLVLLAACDTTSFETPPPVIEGREETRNIRNTREIGGAGDAIANKVDQALDANDQRMERLRESEAANQ